MDMDIIDIYLSMGIVDMLCMDMDIIDIYLSMGIIYILCMDMEIIDTYLSIYGYYIHIMYGYRYHCIIDVYLSMDTDMEITRGYHLRRKHQTLYHGCGRMWI